MQLYGETRGFSLGLPVQPTLLADGKRVLFLRGEAKKTSLSLFSFDLETKETTCLLTPERLLGGSEGELSAEEKARRERLRLTTSGLVSFSVSDSNQWLLLPLAGRVFLYRLSDGKVLSPEAHGVIDPQLAPNDAHLAYVKDGELYVWSLATQRETRLTEGATALITNGLAEFVAQEEMQRMRGYWWNPAGTHIAYARVDNSALEQFFIADPMHPEKAPLHFRYPRAGKMNADVRVFVTALDTHASVEFVWDREQFPYLARAGWSAQAGFYALVQTRDQRSEVLITQAGARIVEEQDDAWINLDRTSPLWLRDGSGFLWMSEKSGQWQIEKRSVQGVLERTLQVPGLHEMLRVDAAGQNVLVLASDEETSLQLYALPLDGGAPRAITSEVGERLVAFGRQSALFVETIGTRERSRRVVVRRVSDGAELCELPRVNLEAPATPNITWLTVESHRAVVIKPQHFDANARYPVVLSVYGGPHHNSVLSQRDSYWREQWLADQGFIVAISDNRGTPRRGRIWERAIAGDFSQVALDDQVLVLQALAKRIPQMDLDRVGVYGWSFGGYMAALCALRRPDVFKRAVAGAPVVDWLDYDTHYTERYLGTPQTNPQGYARSSLLTYAQDLKRPLLLIHGTADDNVYFFHTLKLSDALTRAGIAHEVLPLCGFTHMVPEPAMLSRLWGAIARHFAPLRVGV